jgi:iron complex outermembrane receptor protein
MLMLLLGGSRAQGQSIAESLADLSIEQLLNEPVNSVTKRTTRQFDSPAAITVLTQDDLLRSGARSVPDALRLVPGMNVGAVNSSQYAVSARGFSTVFSNKMLVLVDGRAVYNALFAGVFWDLQQPLMEDLNRIEVIRGPGAAIWGANAMNGVINIVSSSARDTQGGLAYLGGGNVQRMMAGGRYGGVIGDDLYYRVFATMQSRDDYLLGNGQHAGDGWRSWHSGFRLDKYANADTHLTWQADATVLDLESGVSDGYNVNSLARWNKELSSRSSLELQVYYDRIHRNDSLRALYSGDTFDVALQHIFPLGMRHDITWGAGYRFVTNSVEDIARNVDIREGSFDRNLYSLFIQDEWQMLPNRLTATLGARLEHNDFTGLELQPNLRLLFKPTEKQTLWAAVSRAVRTPSALEAMDVFVVDFAPPAPGPGGVYVPRIVGNAAPRAEVLWAYEMGYRIQPHERLILDASVFYNDYSRLIALHEVNRYIPGVPVGTAELPFQNVLSAETYGGEITATLSPSDAWRLTASYSLLLANFHGPATSRTSIQEKSIPTHQVVLRSSYDFSPRVSLDVQVRYVDQIETVPAYATADLRLLYRVTDRLDFSIVGQNLFSDDQPEQRAQPVTLTSAVPRGVYGKVTWRF